MDDVLTSPAEAQHRYRKTIKLLYQPGTEEQKELNPNFPSHISKSLTEIGMEVDNEILLYGSVVLCQAYHL